MSINEKEHIENEVTVRPVVWTHGWSHPIEFDKDFIVYVAKSVFAVMGEFVGSELELDGHTPGWAETPECGFFTLNFTNAAGSEVRIGVNFGETNADNTYVRRPFNREQWLMDRENPHSAEIWIGSWDEAWAFICLLGNRLQVARVRLIYGV